MKKIIVKLIMVLGLISGATTKAEEANNVLLYIQPYEYTNEIKLMHYAQEYWYAQGPIVEPIAKEKLTELYGNVAMCEGNQTGKMLIWVQPRMFYNSQSQVFYGKITVIVYTGVGKFVGTYTEDSKQYGYLGIKPEHWLKKAYTKAMDGVVAKMKADSQLQSAMSNPASTSTLDTPCSMVTLLPVPKIRAMSF